MKKTLATLAVGMALYGMSHCDEGVMQVDARVNATAASLRLEASDLRTWLCRVLDAWGLRVRQFRQVDGAWPVFAECTLECSKFFSLHAAAAALRMKTDRSGMGRHREDERKRRSTEGTSAGQESLRNSRPAKDARRGEDGTWGEQGAGPTGKGKRGEDKLGDAAGGATGRQKEWPSAWPEKPRMDAETYASFCDRVRRECGDACRFFLVGKCSKGADCPKSHAVPPAYARVKAQSLNQYKPQYG